jgi:hypothetical protein
MGGRGSSASSIARSRAGVDAQVVANAPPLVSIRIEVSTPALAADLASLLRPCGYEDVEVAGRFVNVTRANPGPPSLENIRLAALLDIWRRRHGGAVATRRH